jgi:hypothetical protein
VIAPRASTSCARATLFAKRSVAMSRRAVSSHSNVDIAPDPFTTVRAWRHRHVEFAEPQSLSLLCANARGRPLADGRGRAAMQVWGCQARLGTAAVRRHDESARFSCRRHAGGATMPRMRTIITLSLSVFLGCGGQTAVTNDAGSSGSSDSSSGSSGGSSSSSGGSSGGSSGSSSGTPPVDSGECDSSMECVLCTDGNWHCPFGNVYPQCPPGTQAGGSCNGDAGLMSCVTCASNGTGDRWFCFGGNWQGSVLECSPP